MFSFHKPKVYRSSTGCCICKAKSSSSRFTDSRKYEDDFQECFHLSSPRQGDICNACVLLVKRFKRLPSGSERHWGYVVDARGGPGIKCMSKFKKKRDELFNSIEKRPKIKFSSTSSSSEKVTERKEREPKFEREGSPSLSDDSWGSDEDGGGSDDEAMVPKPKLLVSKRKPRKASITAKRIPLSRSDSDSFLDPEHWTREEVCCGTIWKGLNNSVVLDTRYYKPCQVHRSVSANSVTLSSKESDLPQAKLFSDNSSDSGYDDSSNHTLTLDSLNVKDKSLMSVDLSQKSVSCPPAAQPPLEQKRITILKKKLLEVSKPVRVITNTHN